MELTGHLSLIRRALEGVRLGVARTIFEREASTERLNLFDAALKELEAAGAVIIDDIDLGTMENDLGYNVLLYEFKAALNAYLGKTPTNKSDSYIVRCYRFQQ